MPALAMCIAVFLWASSVVGTKYAIGEIAVAELIVLRLMLGAAGLWLMVLLTGADARPRRVGWKPFVMGLLEPGLVTVLFTIGLTLTSPVNGSVLWSLMPLLMPVLGRIFLGEAIRPVVIVAALLAVGATVLLAWGQRGHGGGSFEGDVLLVGAVLAAAINALIGRRTAQAGANPLVTSSWQVAVACVVTAPLLALLPTADRHITSAGSASLTTVLYLGLVVTVGVFILSNYAMRHMPVGRMALFGCAVGPVGTALSALVFGTTVTLLDMAAIALVMAAVALPSLLDLWRGRSLPEPARHG
ncbi:MAG TPA: DMT family transporter [Vineibacter sp.]|nr:DMT family transporter [Vineibacter sp.]